MKLLISPHPKSSFRHLFRRNGKLVFTLLLLFIFSLQSTARPWHKRLFIKENFGAISNSSSGENDGNEGKAKSKDKTKTGANTPPGFDSSPKTTAGDNAPYVYFIETSDADGDPLTVTAPTLPSWLSFHNPTDLTVHTSAGNGTGTMADGSGTSAQFSDPNKIAADASGNLYVVDEDRMFIRKITVSGEVTTLAGNENYVYGGYVDGLGTEAAFDGINAIAVDAQGNVFVSEENNFVIRKITPNGLVSTFAGQHSSYGHENGTGTEAKFKKPNGLVFDASGNLYVTDESYRDIRKITPEGVVTTFVGDPYSLANSDGTGTSARFGNPWAMTIDDEGNIYVSDTYYDIIRKITPEGVSTKYAGGGSNATGSALTVQFTYVPDLAFSKGKIYLLDQNYLKTIDKNGLVEIVAGQSSYGYSDGTATAALFNGPEGITASPSGLIYIADKNNRRIRKVVKATPYLEGSTEGQIGPHNVVLSVTDGVDSENQPFTINVVDGTPPVFSSGTTASFQENSTGTVYTAQAADANVNNTVSYSLPTGYDNDFFNINASSGELTFKASPDYDAFADGDNNNIYLAGIVASDGSNQATQVVSITVTNVNEEPEFTSTEITSLDENGAYSYAIAATDPDQNLLQISAPTLPSWLSLAGSIGNVVETYAGEKTRSFTGYDDVALSQVAFDSPATITMDGLGNIFVRDDESQVRKIGIDGMVTWYAGAITFGTTIGPGPSLNGVAGMVADDEGNLFISASGSRTIYKITPNHDVTILAGGGSYGYKDGTGTEAQFFNQAGIDLDADGNLYVADKSNHKLRKVSPEGVVTTIAGSNQGIKEGTGTEARFYNPTQVAVGNDGNIYVADLSTIRKVTPEGVVTRLAGGNGSGYIDGTGTGALFRNIDAIDLDDNNNVYVVQRSDNVIRKITPEGVVTTVFGSSSYGNVDGTGTASRFQNPSGLVIDKAGNIFISDEGNKTIRLVKGSTILEGTANVAPNNYNVVLTATDPGGLSDSQSFAITVSDITDPVFASATTASVAENTTEAVYTAVATDGSAITYSLGSSNDEALFNIDGTTGEVTFISIPDFENPSDGDTDNVYVINVKASDGTNEVDQNVTISVTDVHDFDPVFTSTPTITVGDNETNYEYSAYAFDGDLTDVQFTAPTLPAWLSASFSVKNDVIDKFGSDNGPANGTGTEILFSYPNGILIDDDGNIYVSEDGSNAIRKITPDGVSSNFVGSLTEYANVDGTGTDARFRGGGGMDFDSQGNIYLAGLNTNSIRKITPEGVVTTIAGGGSPFSENGVGTGASFHSPFDLAIDSQDNIYVVEFNSTAIRKITPDGTVTTFAGLLNGYGYLDGTGTDARFTYLLGISIDGEDNLYVADTYNERIRKISPSGEVTTFAGNGTNSNIDGIGTNATFSRPEGIHTTPEGISYVFSESEGTVREIKPNGQVTTIIGDVSTGDLEGLGTNARLKQPTDIAVDKNGNLFIVDHKSHKIKMASAGTITLTGSTVDQVGTHTIKITATDGDGVSTDQDFTITVSDATAPTFSSGLTANFAENGTGTVYTAGATDTNSQATLAYSFGSGNDEALFNIDGTTGEVTFKTSPDFEIPADANEDNDYVINIIASDGINDTDQDVTVTVTNVHDFDPVFTSTPTITVGDNETNYKYSAYAFDGDLTDVQFTAPTLPTWLSKKIIAKYDVIDTLGGSYGSINGTGTEIGFSFPEGILIDDDGIMYVSEGGNGAIRKITPEGVSSTFVGSLTEYGNVDGTGTDARFLGTGGMDFDSQGNIYVAGVNTHTIRKITPEGVVTTVAGNGSAASVNGVGTGASFDTPVDLVIDSQDNIYVVEEKSHAVRKIAPDGTVTTFAGAIGIHGYQEGSGTNARFYYISGISIDGKDNLYIAGKYNERIRKISPSGEVTTFAGNGTSGNTDGIGTNATFSLPNGIHTTPEGISYVFSEGKGTVRRITSDGEVTTIIGNVTSGDLEGIGTNARLSNPKDLAIDKNGNLFILDHQNHKIKMASAGAIALIGSTVDQVGTHTVKITATDGDGASTDQDFTITVSDATAPTFSSGLTANFAENGTGTVYTAGATDTNSQATVAYSFGTGNDEAMFNIDGTTGEVTFKTSPDFEIPADANTDNAYVINVIVSDGINTVNQNVTITVTNVDDTDPVFTSATSTTFAENGTGVAYTVAATDANTITYSFGSGNDEALFNIDGTTGEVTFKTSPDFEIPTDANTDNAYVINVIASDGINSVNQNVTITVTNVDDTDPVFTSSTSTTFAENGTGVAYTVTATDANTITYSLGTGNDEALFNIDGTTGEVTFKTSPDFEIPTDANTDNAYVINVIASDGINTVNQNVTITVTNVDDTDPVFTSATSTTFAENGTGVAYTVTATDANTIMYSFGSGNDETLFNIDGTTGEVTFKTSPDFEIPSDANADNDYVINVVASDGINTSEITVSVQVTDNNDNYPVITSNGGGAVTEISIPEMSTTLITTVTATDADALTPYFNFILNSGADEQLFSIDLTTGELSFNIVPDFENPQDSNGDNVYEVAVLAIDGPQATEGTLATRQMIKITITNVDDTDPVFTSSISTTFAENGTGVAYTVAATDANAITYSFGSGNDEALFDIDGTTGEVTFKTSPDFEIPADANTDNDYVINVVASDGINTVNQDVTITVNNVDDTDPVFTSSTSTTFAENGTGVAYTVAATDVNTITYSLGTGNDEALFDIDGTTGEVTFKTSPDFEIPIDANTDNAYVINVIASDGINTVNQNVTITVTNVDDTDPVFTSSTSTTFAENGTGVAYTVAATDANAITYSFGTGNDEALFNIDGTTGEVTFKISPDFEIPTDVNTDNAYVTNVIASDGINTVNQDVTITVTNVDDTDPVFTSATSVNYAENGTGVAYTITATDATAITYSFGSGNDEALFNIDGTTGEVTFKISPDFEIPTDVNTDNAYVINVIASDGINSVNQDVTIMVTNVDDTDPVFTSSTSVNYAENGTGVAYTVLATDANAITYSFGSGNDEVLFNIDGTTGEVTFKTSPDFEIPTDANTDNAYVINVIASDGINSVNQDVTIMVTNVDDTDPVFTSSTSTTFAENGTGVAYTVSATDVNAITYSFGSGNDEALFNIDGTTGEVTFKTSPDFEIPADANAENVYVVNVIASDGINTVDQNVTITVTNVDDTDPVFTSVTSVNYAENGTGVAYTASATDVNAITYSFGSGNDEALFNIDGTTGEVTFKTSPDFEIPTDANTDNAYVINVIASDGINSVNQNVTITVTDVDEVAPSVTLTAGDLADGAYVITAQFSEAITGFAVSDITTDATISDFTAVDGDTYTFSVTSSGNSASVSIAANVVTDATGNSNTASNTLNLVYNVAPTGITLSASSIVENNAVDAEIGIFSTTDDDAGDTHTYALVSGEGDADNASFTISGSSLQAAEAFDFETKSSYSIRVKTTDANGNTFEKAFEISVENQAEAMITVDGETEFEQTILGLTSTITWTISNDGDADTEVTLSQASEFFGLSESSIHVGAGESKEVTLSFSPMEAKVYTSEVSFAYQVTSAIEGSLTKDLSGEGIIVTGIDNGQIKESQINVYPNPASTYITIDLSELNGMPVDINMINPNGVAVFQKADFDQPELRLDVSSYSSGLYIIRFNNGKSLVRKKVLVRK